MNALNELSRKYIRDDIIEEKLACQRMQNSLSFE